MLHTADQDWATLVKAREIILRFYERSYYSFSKASVVHQASLETYLYVVLAPNLRPF